MLAKARGGDRGAGGSSFSYVAALKQSSGGGHAMAPGGKASGRRSSSVCIKPESKAGSFHKGLIRSSHGT